MSKKSLSTLQMCRSIKNIAFTVLSTIIFSLPSFAADANKSTPSSSAKFSYEHTQDLCTQEPKSQWLPEAEMRLLAEFRGYKISTFKIANNSCYEIYGYKSGQMVEAYFNPITSKLVRENIAK